MEDVAQKPTRLMSLDVLRGFDMWFISGGTAMVLALCTFFGASEGVIAQQMKHVVWEGFHHQDTIFPLFMFMAGVTWPFSLASQVAKGAGTWQIYRKILIRSAVLFALGFLYQNFGISLKADFRLMGVLNFIGPSWGIAAILYYHIRSAWGRTCVVVALLVGFWAILRFAVAPDAPFGADSFSKEWNIVSYLDRTLWPTHLMSKGVYEPESVFSLSGGVAMVLLGTLAGDILRSAALTAYRKLGVLVICGFAALVCYFIFTQLLGDKVVKALWTSSFVFAAACYSFLMMALFYWVVDILQFRRWTLYFKVIGMNSITIYMAQSVIGFDQVRRWFFGGLANVVPVAYSPLVLEAGYLVVVWAFLYFLYRKNIFLKV